MWLLKINIHSLISWHEIIVFKEVLNTVKKSCIILLTRKLAKVSMQHYASKNLTLSSLQIKVFSMNYCILVLLEMCSVNTDGERASPAIA